MIKFYKRIFNEICNELYENKNGKWDFIAAEEEADELAGHLMGIGSEWKNGDIIHYYIKQESEKKQL